MLQAHQYNFYGKSKIEKTSKKYETVIIKGEMLFSFILLLYLLLMLQNIQNLIKESTPNDISVKHYNISGWYWKHTSTISLVKVK